MTAQNQSNDLNAIKTSLLKIAQDIGQPPVAAPGQSAAPAPGSPEEVMGLIDDAIQVLEVAAESVPAETPGQPAPAPAPAAPITAKSKTAQEGEEKKEGEKKEATDEEKKEGEKKEAGEHEEDETEKEKELSARIAVLEDEVEEKEKEKVAKDFVQLYPQDVRQAKFDAIIASDVKSTVLNEQFKVAQDLSEAQKPVSTYIPATSQSGYLIKKASMNKTIVPVWRT